MMQSLHAAQCSTMRRYVTALVAIEAVQPVPAPIPTPRQALMDLFLAVTGFFMQHRSALMSEEIVALLKAVHGLAHDDHVNHKAELCYAVEKISVLRVISADPGVAEALRLARIVLMAEKTTMRLDAVGVHR